MANLAIGATGNCVVNTLMNTFFKTYKELRGKGIINEEVLKSLTQVDSRHYYL
jgi:hypothetical protein